MSTQYLRYAIDENHLDDLSSRAERIALGLNPDTGRGAGTLAASTSTSIAPRSMCRRIRTVVS